MNPFPTLSSTDLECTSGGAGKAAVCTPANPSGARQPTQFFEKNNAAKLREPPNPAHYNFFTNPKDLHAKSSAIVDAFK
jgi:hypothetical protein